MQPLAVPSPTLPSTIQRFLELKNPTFLCALSRSRIHQEISHFHFKMNLKWFRTFPFSVGPLLYPEEYFEGERITEAAQEPWAALRYSPQV